MFVKSCSFTKSRDGINKNVYLGSWLLFTKSWDSLNQASLNQASLNRDLGVIVFYLKTLINPVGFQYENPTIFWPGPLLKASNPQVVWLYIMISFTTSFLLSLRTHLQYCKSNWNMSEKGSDQPHTTSSQISTFDF